MGLGRLARGMKVNDTGTEGCTGGGGQRRDGGGIVKPQLSYYLLFKCKTQLNSA